MSIEYDENGLTIQTFTEIVEERQEALQPIFGSDLDLTGDSVIGNVQLSDADREFSIQELVAFLVNQMSLSNSSGIFLDWNAQFKNQSRLSPLKTIITRTINGTNGTTITAGSLTITDNDNGYNFVITDAVIIGSTGKVQGQFESFGYENIEVNSGDTFSIATPLSGVTSITYTTGDSVVQEGRGAETDEDFRARAVGSSLAGSLGLSEAIVDKILLLDDVETASYIENKSSTDWTYETYTVGTANISSSADTFTIDGSTGAIFLTELDTNYQIKWEDDASDEQTAVVSAIPSNDEITTRNKITTDTLTPTTWEYAEPVLPPNSFEIIVLGGDNTEIGETIMNNQVPTAYSYGNTNVIVIDSQGQAVSINFTRPTEIDVEMELDVYYTSALTIDEQAALKTALVGYWNSLKTVDTNKGVALDMDADDFAQVSNTNSKIRKIRDILINKPSEAQTDYIEIDTREIAQLSSDDITLNLISV